MFGCQQTEQHHTQGQIGSYLCHQGDQGRRSGPNSLGAFCHNRGAVIQGSTKEVQDRGVGQGREPSEMLHVVNPGSNGVCPGGDGASGMETNLGRIRPQLDPVVDERAKTRQWPDNTEERDISKLVVM